ncbi:MAG: hypothetical protein H6953_07050 [Chromatiaceae bacterium]|nr:hypothetical protein [Gammaproteobacteria bacterium]MCP5305188.1 hypothetical protein [Chromatiaceae bacterium]MCP5315147.1 hypothetical protein [Chromatiaceae bacterium]
MKRYRIARQIYGLFALGLLLATSGCGFQLRGQAGTNGVPDPLYISGISPITDLHRELRRQMDAAGIALADSAAAAQASLVINAWERDARVLSVDSRNKAVEYELEEIVVFTLRGHDGDEWLPATTERVVRIQYRPPTSVLGSARESELQRQDMLSELVTRILRRAAAAR